LVLGGSSRTIDISEESESFALVSAFDTSGSEGLVKADFSTGDVSLGLSDFTSVGFFADTFSFSDESGSDSDIALFDFVLMTVPLTFLAVAIFFTSFTGSDEEFASSEDSRSNFEITFLFCFLPLVALLVFGMIFFLVGGVEAALASLSSSSKEASLI